MRVAYISSGKTSARAAIVDRSIIDVFIPSRQSFDTTDKMLIYRNKNNNNNNLGVRITSVGTRNFPFQNSIGDFRARLAAQ